MNIETFRALNGDKRFSVSGVKVENEEEKDTYDTYSFDSIKEAKAFDYPKEWETYHLEITEWEHDSEHTDQTSYYNKEVSTCYLKFLDGSEKNLNQIK
jgi:hypothetical protein